MNGVLIAFIRRIASVSTPVEAPPGTAAFIEICTAERNDGVSASVVRGLILRSFRHMMGDGNRRSRACLYNKLFSALKAYWKRLSSGSLNSFPALERRRRHRNLERLRQLELLC